MTDRQLPDCSDPHAETAYVEMLFQRHPLPMLIYDPATLRIIDANHAASVQYGYTVDEFTDLTVLDLNEPENHDQLRRRATDGHEYRRVCKRHVRYDGSVIEVEVFSNEVQVSGRKMRLVTAIDRSRQSAAEHEARTNREFTQAIMDGLPDAIFIKDSRGRIEFVNRAACEIAVRSSEDIVGRLDSEVFGAEVAAAFRRDERPVIESGKVVEAEQHLTVSGSARVFHAVLVPWRTDAGTIKGVIGISRDIGERKRIEAELHAVQERIRLVHDHSPFGSAIAGLDGWWLHVNPAMCRMLGYSEEELRERKYEDISHPDDVNEASRAAVQELLNGSMPYDRRVKRYIHKTGRPVWVDLTISIARDSQNAPAYFIVHVEDITQKRETELALRAADTELRSSQKRLQMLMRQAPAVMWTTDRALVVNWTDGAGYRFLRVGAQEVLETSLLDWFEENSPPITVHRRALEGEPGEYELQLGTRWYNVHADPLRDDEGSVVGVIAMAIDLTIAKDAQEALRRQEEQLRQSQKMEAIGRLAGGVAHDFNNLLTAITGHSELLLDQLDARDPCVADIEQIRRAAERAARLTRQLLAFSRRQILDPIIIDMHSVLADLEPLLRRLIGDDIELSCVRQNSGACCLLADKGQLEQVIMNLVVNARDAMPYGGRITIGAERVVMVEARRSNSVVVPPGEYVCLTVQDSGVGIPPEHFAQIFEPFFTTKGRDKGTGLGLSTVYGIIQQSGGRILVDSVVGNGTTFSIYLPTADGSAQQTQPTRTRVAWEASGGETIILVEDEPAVRELVHRTLRRTGFKVLMAANGDEAILVAERHKGPIDLLVTDIVMPRMSGIELASYLTRQRPRLKVLFMSGYTEEAIERHGVPTAGHAFIQKPFTPGMLRAKVSEVLNSFPSGNSVSGADVESLMHARDAQGA